MQSLYKLPTPTPTFLRQLRNPITVQTRHKKPANTSQTRLENRTLDSHLDKLSLTHKRLSQILTLHSLFHRRKRGPYVSLQLASRWQNIAALNVPVSSFIRSHPHVFDVFTHPVKGILCCRVRAGFDMLVREDNVGVRNWVGKVRRLVMLSGGCGIGVKGFVLDGVELVEWDESLARGAVEDWREREWREKWLSEFEIKYAFPICFPTGFRMAAGFRGKLRDWQRLPYLKVYERKDGGEVGVKGCGGVQRYEKRAVAVLHEFLSLMVEKKVGVERLSHFRRDLGIEVNIRELLLKHPGIFYISTRDGKQTVFLREAYKRGRLIESNPIYEVRRKMLDLVLLRRRNTRELKSRRDVEGKELGDVSYVGGERDGRCSLPLLDSLEDRKTGILTI